MDRRLYSTVKNGISTRTRLPGVRPEAGHVDCHGRHGHFGRGLVYWLLVLVMMSVAMVDDWRGGRIDRGYDREVSNGLGVGAEMRGNGLMRFW
ncbi:hypothetical protein M6B38_340380 [Iris pallida]|uniref:Uncharacterized protein n=1 Tax=Iris pallida TaxID=29817 RepID=A0AAX6GYJ8_IRIPA|nr:hypothetical protein M6B38_340380 [Iris pallida]